MTHDPTNAERQARHRAKQSARVAALEAEVTRLRAKLASRDGAAATEMPRTAAEWAAAKLEATAKRKAMRAAAKAARLAAAPAQEQSIEVLTAEIDKLKRELVSRNTRIKNLRITIRILTTEREGKVIYIPAKLYREIEWHVHPDRWPPAARKRAERCLAQFNQRFEPEKKMEEN
jgi:hypothetical protein